MLSKETVQALCLGRCGNICLFISAPEMLKQEDFKLDSSLAYTARPCLKNQPMSSTTNNKALFFSFSFSRPMSQVTQVDLYKQSRFSTGLLKVVTVFHLQKILHNPENIGI